MCELKSRMPYAEFIQHIAYYRRHPWGDDWQQAGTMAWASIAPHTKRHYKPDDFIPKVKRKQSLQEMWEVMTSLASKQNVGVNQQNRGSG